MSFSFWRLFMNTLLLLLPLGSVRWERGRVKVAVTRSKHAGTLSSIISFPTIRRRRITLHNKLPHYTCYTCFGDPFCGFCA